MDFYLEKWDHSSTKIELPDGTTEVAGVIISGDEVLVWPVYCDPQRVNRTTDFFEGQFCRVLKDGRWVDKEDYKEIEV